MWIYLLAPFLALLPKRWRKSLPFHDIVPWRSAAILSGLAESVIALAALMYWYSYSVTTWVSHGLDTVLNGKAPPGTTDHEIGFVALVLWATHPLTWTIAFFGIEGMARVCAAITDTVLGVFPLYLIEKIYSKVLRRREPEATTAPEFSQGHISSHVGSVREKVLTTRLSRVPDEHRIIRDATDEILEIRAWQAKPEWSPPRVIRYQEGYYRLEDCSRGPAPRPFVYKLRRLAAGVPGRTVIVYAPDEAPFIASH
jgi:hypothetical protein